MKTARLLSLTLSCALLVCGTFAATDVGAGGWYAELSDIQQSSHQSDGGRVRAITVLRAALVASGKGLPNETPPAGANLQVAAAHAAYSVMAVLYPESLPALDAQLAESLADVDDTLTAITTGKDWGKHVAAIVLADQSDTVFLNPASFGAQQQAPDNPPIVPEVHAAEAEIGSGRYEFTVLAGVSGTKGHVDGTGVAARFDNPGGIAVDAAGNVYVSEIAASTIRKITPDGVVTTLAGTIGQPGSQDGAGAAARFKSPAGLAVDGAGNVYVADAGNGTIRKIDPSGNVTTYAGKAGEMGTADGPRNVARFLDPAYIAVDAAGNVFVTEDKFGLRSAIDFSGPIRKITPDGTVSTLTLQAMGSAPHGSPQYPYYGTPKQICVDRAGNVYVIDSNGWDYSYVTKLTPAAQGGRYVSSRIEPPAHEGVWWVTGIGLDETDRLFVRGHDQPLYVYTPDGGWRPQYATGAGDDISWIEEVTVSRSGDLYITRNDGSGDTELIGAVVRGWFDPSSTGPTITVQPKPPTTTPWQGDSARFEVTATGTPPLSYQWFFNSNPITGATNSSLEIPNVQREALGMYSVVVSDRVGSVTSRKAGLSMLHRSDPMPLTPTPTTPAPSGANASTSGGGSFDAEISLAVLGLLAAAAVRRRYRISPVAAGEPQ